MLKRGERRCPRCGSISFPDMELPQPKRQSKVRRFFCSEQGHRFSVVVTDNKELRYIDKKMGRRRL